MTWSIKRNGILLSSMPNKAIVFFKRGMILQVDISQPLLLLFLPSYNIEVISGYKASIFGFTKAKTTT